MMTSLLIKFLRFKVLFNLPLALQPYLKIAFRRLSNCLHHRLWWPTRLLSDTYMRLFDRGSVISCVNITLPAQHRLVKTTVSESVLPVYAMFMWYFGVVVAVRCLRLSFYCLIDQVRSNDARWQNVLFSQVLLS